LIDALPEEKNLWGQTYERAKTDVLMMYSEVTRAIADKIQVKLTTQEETRLASAHQVNPEAYEAYLKGQFHWGKFTLGDMEMAMKYYELALKEDPNFALAYAGIALIWGGRAQFGLLPPREATPKAKAAAEKAVELDNTLAEVHFVLAAIRTWLEWDWEGAEIAFQRAIELNPNYPDARVYYSNLLCYMGRPEEALAQAERAVELDPLNSLYQGICGTTLVYLRRYDDAIARFRNVLRTSPNDQVGNDGLWQSFHMKGMYEEALAAAKALYTGMGHAEIGEVMERGYKEDGYSGAMSLAAETLEEISREAFIGPYLIFILYASAGKKEQTLEWLERGYEIKDPNMPYINDPRFDFLRDEPRFQDLLRKMNLPELE